MAQSGKKLCLAASGGGHLRQLMQMLPAFKDHDFYFLTEATPLGLSLVDKYRVRLVPHFAFGQRKSDGYLRFFWAAFTNFVMSVLHFLRERPDVIITTGAGAAFYTIIFGWVFRRKVIILESLARVKSISKFGELAARYATHYLVQWPDLVQLNAKAVHCNPFIPVDIPVRDKEEKIFVTVGTVMPFDRILGYVDDLIDEGFITETVVAQIGESDYSSKNFECHQTFHQDQMIGHLRSAKIAIVHGGSGSMLGAMREGCNVIGIPREAKHGEHYDDHQFELVGAFRDLGTVTEVHSKEELKAAITNLRTAKPKAVEIDPEAYARFFREYI